MPSPRVTTHPDPTATARSGRPRGALLGLLASVLTVTLLAPVQPASSAPAAPTKLTAARTTTPDSFTPKTGARFNNPLGGATAQRRLLTQVIRTVDSAPRGSAIRMAVYSFADSQVADALLRAHRRGVQVKLVFSGTTVYDAMRRLQRTLGSDHRARSFVVICDRSCRGAAGEMHAKYFAFTKAGKAEHVTMVGSVNVTRYNAQQQWNDLYTVANDKQYFMAYRTWFTQLKKDRPRAAPYLVKQTGAATIDFSPIDLATTYDPVLAAMDQVACQVLAGQVDPASPTPDAVVPSNVLISAHAWNGERGKTIARRVVALAQAGCLVQVFYGVGIGSAVLAILTDGGVATGGRVAVTRGAQPKARTHQKVMVVRGGYAGDPDTTVAWTGSQNWSDRATGRDELFVRINDETVARKYLSAFVRMWARG